MDAIVVTKVKNGQLVLTFEEYEVMDFSNAIMCGNSNELRYAVDSTFERIEEEKEGLKELVTSEGGKSPIAYPGMDDKDKDKEV